MKYKPEQAIACLPQGDYEATIERAEEVTSKTNKPMLVISYKVYGPHNRTIEIKDYIVEEMLWKLKRIATAIGQMDAFNKGEFFAADYVSHNLTLTLTVEENSDFGDQNRIKAYKQLSRTGTAARPASNPSPVKSYAGSIAAPPMENQDGDIPF